MSILNVGGVNPFNRVKTFQEALDKAKPDDTIRIHKKITVANTINKHVIIDAGNNDIVIESGQAGLIFNTPAIIKNAKFIVGSRANAIILEAGGILENVDVKLKGPIHEFYPTILHKSGKLEISNSKLQMLSTFNETRTTITDSEFTDYYGGVHELSSYANLSTLAGEVNIINSTVSMVYFAGIIKVINSTIGQFNVNSSQVMHLDNPTFTVLEPTAKINMKKEPGHGPLTHLNSQNKYLIHNRTHLMVSNYQIQDVKDYAVIFSTDGAVDILDVNNEQDARHLMRNTALSVTNVTDKAYYYLEDSILSQVNSTIDTNMESKSALEELQTLVGLDSVKKSVENIMNTIKMNQSSSNDNFEFAHHMVFAGDPGTGKTTVAKIVAQALFEIGAISENKLTEVTVDKLIKGYVGQTASNVREILDEALGGVLFIDEAYELSVKDDQKSFNSEALSVIIRYMEDHRDNLVVIAAGYTKEMREFLASNIGLQRRFQWVSFEDYSTQEMSDIFELMRESHDKEYEDIRLKAVVPRLFDQLTKIYLNKPDINGRITNGGNGGLVRNVYQQVIQEYNNRIISGENTEVRITQQDLAKGFKAEIDKATNI